MNANQVPQDDQYTHANVCADSGLLCRSCAIQERDRLADVDPACPDDDQWRIVGTQLVDSHLRCDHCGHLIRTRIDDRPVIGCDQCTVLSINRTACHETGCPRSHIDPATGSAYPIACFECGYDFVPETDGLAVCPDCQLED